MMKSIFHKANALYSLRGVFVQRQVSLAAYLLSKEHSTGAESSAQQQSTTHQSQPNKEPQQESTTERSVEQLNKEMKQLEESLIKAQNNCNELKDKYMRALAETENTRTRLLKQIDDAKIFGIQGFCKDLLEVADVLQLAIDNTSPQRIDYSKLNAQEAKEKLDSMHKGLAMTEKSLLKIFEKHGLVRIVPAEGDRFDPIMHEAIYRVKLPDKQSGTVNTVDKLGYKLRERIIRAAQVGVVA
jgi:molecular chaperone GrpE